MADIFISYSSKDRAQAEQLTELLASAGLSVWIDKSGIDVATSWSEEIVHAIDNCSAFVLMLSASSVLSHNIIKEVSLASEKKKKIFPLDLESVEIPASMQYALAGLQRSPMTNINGIIRAIGKLGLAPTQPPPVTSAKATDSRKSLMILPFQDLSPTGDNAWFADGIVNELIDSLSLVKSLRVTDKQTTAEYKTYTGHLTLYAKEMRVRYFLQGDVRKFGDQIKISCSLLDIETSDHLWQIVHKGTMNDIFDMQEEVAKKVVDGLKIHLLVGEKEQLSSRGTDNAEAYEMYLKAAEFYDRGSKLDIEYALKAIARALELDSHFDKAMLRRAIILIAYHEMYQRKTELLDEAEQLIERVKQRISPEQDWRILGGQALLASIRGEVEKCLALHLENIRVDPNDPHRHDGLGRFFEKEGRFEEAIHEFETVLTIIPDGYPWARTLIGFAWQLKRQDLKVEYAHRYVHLFDARAKLSLEDNDAAVVYGLLLFYTGKLDAARRQLDSIPDDHIQQDNSFRNAAGLAACVGQPERAINLLERLLTMEFDQSTPEWHQWLDEAEFDPIRDSEPFIRLKQAFEEKRKQHG